MGSCERKAMMSPPAVLQLIMLVVTAVSVSTACPYPCTCTQFKVDCYDKGLEEIPDNFPPDVTSIDLQYNHIHTVRADQFRNLTSLTELMLRFNSITQLEEDAFAHLPSLKHVNLGSNRIANLTAGAFRNVSQMQILDLTDNRLTGVEGGLEGLTSLTKLVLTRNLLEELTEGSLQPLTNLVYFMADENLIRSVHPAAFSSLSRLSFVSLIMNPLTSMDGVLSHNHMLSYLNLDDCQLTQVPIGLPWATRNLQLQRNNIQTLSRDTFASTQYLGVVMLDGNNISTVEPGALTPIAHLQELWLSDNRLSRIPTPLPATLKTLFLENNNISAVTSKDWPQDSQLKVLSLKGNGIRQVDPFTFSPLTALEKLYVSDNHIAQLQEKSFFGMRNLTLLDVSQNPVEHIDIRFAAGLHKLATLYLSHINDSEPFVQGDFFRDLPFLQTLLLRDSPVLARHILTSNDTLQSFYNLEELDARDNGFGSLEADLPRFFPSLQRLRLAGNAWHCDPRLLWLHDWMQASRGIFLDLERVRCASPWHLLGSVIADLPYHAFFYTTTIPTTTMSSSSSSSTTEDADFGGSGGGEEEGLSTGSPFTAETTTPEGYTDFDPDKTDVTPGKEGGQPTSTDGAMTTLMTTSKPDGSNDTGEKTSRVKLTTSTLPSKTTDSVFTSTSSAKTSREHTTPPPSQTTSTTTSTPSTPTSPRTSPPATTTTTTTTTTTLRPKLTDIPRYGGSKIKQTEQHSSSFTRNIIIATAVAGVVLIIVIVAMVMILRQKRKIYWVLNRGARRAQQSGDTEMVLNDQDDHDSDSRSDFNSMGGCGHEGSTSVSTSPSVEMASDDGLCTRLV